MRRDGHGRRARLRWSLPALFLLTIGVYVAAGGRTAGSSIASKTTEQGLQRMAAERGPGPGREGAPRLSRSSSVASPPVSALPQAGTARIAGMVVDASGGPIAGAVLSALDAQKRVLAKVVSDGAGAFALHVAAGVSVVSARADGYSEQLQTLRAPVAGVRFALSPASSIVGRTVSELGAPIAGARVVALGRDGLWAVPPPALSGADGTFRLDDVPAGRYALVAVSERWRSDEHIAHVGVAETTEPIELRLRAATTLTAVVKVAGTACEQGSISLSGPLSGYEPLQQEGRAVFEGLLPGRYQVSIECEAGLERVDDLDLDQEPVTRVWELEQGLRLSGIALTPGGAPLVGVPIEVKPVGEALERSYAHCTSDERGEFTCAGLVAGQYECAIGRGLPLRSEGVRVVLGDGSVPRIVLHSHPEGSIRVRIEAAEQFELPALPLVARGRDAAVHGQLQGDELIFQPLALGSYEIASESSPPGSGSIVELTREGEVAELALSLPSAHTLSGRVVSDDGQPVPDAWVRARLMSRDARVRPVTPVLTDGEGAFSLSGLLPGRYRVNASSGQGEAELDDVASDGRGVIVRLPSYGSLAVSLRSAAGGRVDEFKIAYRRSGDDGGNELPGARGEWSAPWLAPGRYELTVEAAEGSATQTVELPPGGEVKLALQLEPHAPTHAAEESRAGTVGAGR